ncbi:Ferroporti-1 [Chytriomyces sp. MP71]|nr:Ferroporti-1 [Chytriomyces sp. MP71]
MSLHILMPVHRLSLHLSAAYFLTTAATRMDEWAVSLALATAFPSNLLRISVFAFALTTASIVFGASVGSIVDRTPRLRAVRTSIIAQKICAALSAIALWIMLNYVPASETVANSFLFGSVIVTGSVMRLASRATTIAVEKNWVVVIYHQDSLALATVNSHLRRTDLICKLGSPLLVSLLTIPLSIPTSMLVVAGWCLATLPFELYFIQKVYDNVPDLSLPPQPKSNNNDTHESAPVDTELDEEAPSCIEPIQEPETITATKLTNSFVRYWNHPIFLPSLALSLLYLTTLSFGSVMTTWLLLRYTPTFLAGMRALGVLCGLLATFTTKPLISRLGLFSTGLVGAWSQAVCLSVAIVALFLPQGTVVATALFFAGVTLSRWGLWTFDMSETQILQERVEAGESGLISGVEFSLQNMFELLSYVVTMVWNSTDTFWISATISFSAVVLAAVVLSAFQSRKIKENCRRA